MQDVSFRFVKNVVKFTSVTVQGNNTKEQMHFYNSKCVHFCTKVHNEKKFTALLNFAES